MSFDCNAYKAMETCTYKNQTMSEEWSPGRDSNPRSTAYEAVAITPKPPRLILALTFVIR